MWVVDLVIALAVIASGVVLALSATSVVDITESAYQAVSAAVIVLGARLQRTEKSRQARRRRAEQRKERRERRRHPPELRR